MNIGVMKIGARIHENDKIGNSTNEVLATIKSALKWKNLKRTIIVMCYFMQNE